MTKRTRPPESLVADAEIDVASLPLPSLAEDVVALLDLGEGRPREEWAGDGACVGVGLDPFFPVRGSTAANVVAQYCANCPVRVDCLSAGLDARVPGIWGGRGTRHRRELVTMMAASGYGSNPPVAVAAASADVVPAGLAVLDPTTSTEMISVIVTNANQSTEFPDDGPAVQLSLLDLAVMYEAD